MQSVQVSAASARETRLKNSPESPTHFWKSQETMEKHFKHKLQPRASLQAMGIFLLYLLSMGKS